jgi:hypothetical protein
MSKQMRARSKTGTVSGLWLAVASFAFGMLVAPEAHAAASAVTGALGSEGGFLARLLSDVLGFDIGGGSGPRCAGFRACDLTFLAIVAVVIVAVVRLRHQTTRRRLDLARRMVEQGMEPPADLVGNSTGNDLRRGLVLVFTGLGLLGASFLGGKGDLSPAGLIPGFIGLGYLASHRFAGRKRPRP